MISIKRLRLCLLLASLFVSTFNNLSIADEAVYRKTLGNGLIILAKELGAKDLVSINIAIKAGLSSEEEYTASGISHLVEHLVFKGTATRKVGDIEKEIRSYGGLINGTVSHDTTTYEVTVPAKYYTEALSVLKDMLTNAVFDKVELEKEVEVILKEIKLNEDDPEEKLLVRLFENAYVRHSYKYPPIGYEKLLKSLTRDDVVKYYNRRYIPNNMVIAAVGAISVKDAALKIENEFGRFREPSYKPVNRAEREPPQIGKRIVEEEAPITLSYLALGFHSTGLLDKDLFALDVLSMILARGNNSRLNKLLLKDKKEVYSISAWNYTPLDPGLFVITAMLDRNNMDSAEKDILDEIKSIRDTDLADSELENAKRMVLGDYILSRETIENQAADLAESEIAAGNSDFCRLYVEGINKVSKFDIRRAASFYLNEDNMTRITLIPKGSETLTNISVPGIHQEEKFKKFIFPNGLILLIRRDTKIPAVSITVVFSGGLITENEKNNGISNLTAKMLLSGTKNRKESDIKSAIENRGGEISPFSGFNSFGLNLIVLKDDTDLALELIKDVAANSVFALDEIDKEKMLTAAAIKDEKDDIFAAGVQALRRALFKSHPYGMRDIGSDETVRAISRDDLIRFYRSHCAANNTVISVSGDIDPEKIFKKVEALFGDSQRSDRGKTLIPATETCPATAQTVKMDKAQALFMAGFKTVAINSPDRYSLDLLSGLLSGASGRLFIGLREKSALAYTMGSAQKLGIDTGFILFYAATTIDKLGLAKKILFSEIEVLKKSVVTEDELSAAKRELISAHKILMETNAANSFQAALDELYGLGYDNLYKFENEINKVTKYDITRVANKYLDMNSCAEVIIEPD
ncbi:MAG: pitrilysin family protein [Candidatus Omnitrophota bacterium]|nr:pitrilysin family protein [Candidatus Omnitrophota bacterium]